MTSITRRHFALLLPATVAACGGAPQPRGPVFKSYNGPPVTQVVVYKGRRQMYLLSGNRVLKSYGFGLGGQPLGHKQFEGDNKTPEGMYFVDRFNPRSRYHLSVGISYPNAHDRAFAAQYGLSAGGDIMFHGLGPEGRKLVQQRTDWTAGCIAVTDAEMEDIYAMLSMGVPVMIHA
ncbi:L,D-transpeptidase family protein [Paracoccus laeviglucosivorans]|uniref:L,D-transpeptidase catalytic domain n=1 Tax=Paracoccus laeviglucosivorans TaxID=1197861 RepID=A0A521EUB0_9RHOB|nr:L,D-transpeptidase family protein [Paracoccus laeviglucosivorans]SMO86700.1 L,D-transpeptidase catalytic domain [Paracoccus laeviglucosivorans]